MRRYALILGVVATVGCTTPTEPSEPMALTKPEHHNIPATMPNGEVRWVCETQPRTYLRCEDPSNPSRCQRSTQRDHYIADNPCPAVPID